MTTRPRQFGKSALDRAIVASVAAMLGFNILVLAQQVQAVPAFAAAPTVAAQA
ncbi:hypothetical protein ACOYW6_03115 [Parablastomonas sp. CN1-191]|uniref:hypothetical protein n=1 Tax=Parablastomonas sp. CN1-191 TaxID=3400908 RepID=UPI003BF8D5A3